jgi:hypothetical protein
MLRAADFRMDASFRAHPKVRRLEADLGEAGVLAWIQLIAHAAQYKTDGRLTGMTLGDIALAAQWQGDREAFTSKLIEVRLLDQRGKIVALHDWKEHNGYAATYMKRRERGKKAAESRWNSTQETAEQSVSNAQASPMLEHSLGNAPSPDPSPSPSPKPSRKERIKSEIENWFRTVFLPKYPEARRGSQISTALSELRKLNPSAEEREEIMVVLEAWKHHPDWLKGYAPGPGNFFKSEQYKKPPLHHSATLNGRLGPALELGASYIERQNS